MRKLKWVVVMKRDDDVSIRIRQRQCWNRADAIPLRKTDNERAIRIGLADDLDGFFEILIPEFSSQVGIWLIEDFKKELIGIFLVVCRDLLP
jgi:hypothetical protein